MFYLAYGSNLNLSDMKIRCPKARAVGNAVLNDYRLVFCGQDQASWLTVRPSKGEYVPVGIWEIEATDEAAMDIYEGYPELYDKKMMPISFRNETVDALIYIMNEGEKMTVQAQNALLKTLEEPPEYAVILILTSNVSALLPTIQSRCVLLNMKPVKDEQLKQFLMETMEIPDYKADICVAFARGNVGKARLLAKSEEFDKVKEEALALLRNINDMEINEIVAAIKKINEYKFDVNDYLDIFSIWYRDMLLFKATHDANHLIFREEVQYIRKVADKSTYEGIEKIIDALEKSKQRLNANVNFELTMELLLLTIKEN